MIQQILYTILSLLLLSTSITASCSKSVDKPVIEEPKPDEPEVEEKLQIKDVAVPNTLYVSTDKEFSIAGKGFKDGDKLEMQNMDSGEKTTFSANTTDEQRIAFIYKSDLEENRYTLSILRGEEKQRLGVTTVIQVQNLDIADQEGMNIKGMVHVGGKGLAGVVVSDGVEVTKTDENGIYYLPSEKKNRYVFISLPSNYEALTKDRMPIIHKNLNESTETVEIRDFELKESPNDDYVLLVMTDLHLANRNNDINQFQNGFVKDINQTISEYKSQGKKVYGLTLGDLSWDLYWYSNRFSLKEYVQAMQAVEVDVFNVIGNHDNDPYHADDFTSENAYRAHIGPTYYSFNLGQTHYVVLDDTEYLNKGGSSGMIGDRDYNAKITQQQLDWLEKDLATLENPNQPVVIAMHIQLNRNPSLNASGEQVISRRLSNSQDFLNVIEKHNNINILSGHTHTNHRTSEKNGALKEHNIAAVCATWWWTGKSDYANNHISRDGSPGGYSVWEYQGDQHSYYYKSIGYPKDYQFRTYDLNKTHITAEKYTPSASAANKKKFEDNYAHGYVNPSDKNEVLINIWGYEAGWDIQVVENGATLKTTRVHDYDPLHIISYNAKRLNNNAQAGFATSKTAHLFKVQATSPTSTLEITVTDLFGKQYKQTMERPKELTYQMQ